MIYDFLIVGAGLYGSVCARELTNKGFKCLVIDKRNHIAGNCFTEKQHKIDIHKYGPHIFHTHNKDIWSYVNKFSKFNSFVNRPKVKYGDKLYSFPINLFTLYQLYGVSCPSEAEKILETKKVKIENPSNLEEWILSQVGEEIYEIFIKGYTTKQWGRPPKELPSFIIKRLPIRLNFNDNYFFDQFQGIPENGYTELFINLLSGIDVEIGVDFFNSNFSYQNLIYTGPIDKFYNYRFGKLEYRSLRFEEIVLEQSDYQGNAIINYTKLDVPYTRIIEHKHFSEIQSCKTIITKEFPSETGEPYYPINNLENNERYKNYKALSDLETKVFFGGRLSEYKYYDMHQVIGSALHFCNKINPK